MKNLSILAIFLLIAKYAKIDRFFLIFIIFCQINRQNAQNSIVRGWYEKIFETKILVPWDSPEVTGASIS